MKIEQDVGKKKRGKKMSSLTWRRTEPANVRKEDLHSNNRRGRSAWLEKFSRPSFLTSSYKPRKTNVT